MVFGKYIWQDGKFVENPTVPFCCQTVHYGMACFEGIPVYKASKYCAIFRLKEHVERFLNSANILGMEVKLKASEISDAIIGTAKKNKLTTDGYIRPWIGYTEEKLGLTIAGNKTSFLVATMEGSPLGNKQSLKVEIAGTIRPHPASFPMEGKLSGTYVNSAIPKAKAMAGSFDDAIMLDFKGNVAEATTANLFLVNSIGNVITPKSDSILHGITKKTVTEICLDLGIKTREQFVTLEDLDNAEEVFMCGSAAGIKAISEISYPPDNLKKLSTMKVLPNRYTHEKYFCKKSFNPVAPPVTPKISSYYDQVVRGQISNYLSWLTFF